MTALPEKYVCTKCGSDDIRVEADVEWNYETQSWDVNEITWDECNDCLANGYEDVDGHFVVDKSLKGLAVKAIQEASSE
jgi:hypothetical protein